MSLERADSASARMLELVRQVSLAARGVSPQIFLERVCAFVAKALEYDCVTARSDSTWARDGGRRLRLRSG